MAQLQAYKLDATHCVLHVVQGYDKWMGREEIGYKEGTVERVLEGDYQV